MKPENWQAVIDINLSGVFYASKAAASVMLRARRGRIINMASVVGQIGNPGQVCTPSSSVFFLCVFSFVCAFRPSLRRLSFLKTLVTDQNNHCPPSLPLSPPSLLPS
jgi:NAD(P)-dependent dehydrogenase (short-subunit alcohol dehydrogenase family)